VHDALWKFSHLALGIEKVAFVAGIAEGDADATPHRSHLAQLSTVVDVGQPSAGELVRAAFLGH
jgi:hypothetical protein